MTAETAPGPATTTTTTTTALHEPTDWPHPCRLPDKTTAPQKVRDGSASDIPDDPTAPRVIEEDWSCHINPATAEKSFSYYDTVSVPLSGGNRRSTTTDNPQHGLPFDPSERNHHHQQQQQQQQQQKEALVMEIRCMESLTPMDMLDLSNGFSDATGNRIWMGAVLFLECMVRPIDSGVTVDTTTATRSSRSESRRRMPPPPPLPLGERQRDALRNLRARLFRGKRILELGAGTGAALIAVGLAGTGRPNPSGGEDHNDDDDDDDDSDRDETPRHGTGACERPTENRAASLTLTDNDTDVLSLCQMNCDRNLRKLGDAAPFYQVGLLDWGAFCEATVTTAPRGDANASAAAADDSDDRTEPQGDLRFALDAEGLRGTLDTVVANDVIYDTATIPRIFEVAGGLLRDRGIFALAHVPRASIDCEPSRIRDALEKTILAEAARWGFAADLSDGVVPSSWEVLFRQRDAATAIAAATPTPDGFVGIAATGDAVPDVGAGHLEHETESRAPIIRPSTLAKLWADNAVSVSADYDYEELESCGASIMVFVKNDSNRGRPGER